MAVAQPARSPSRTTSDLDRVRIVRDEPLPYGVPAYGHPEWLERFPWLVQGTTARGDSPEPFDLGLFGRTPVGDALARWRLLREAAAARAAVHAPQVHGARVITHEIVASGLVLADEADGHATRVEGALLTVSVADCIPVFVVDPGSRIIAALHAGWRGVVAGVLESGLRTALALGAKDAGSILVHLGPAICGRCYEVGPEVHEALGLERPDGPRPVDLRAVAARRLIGAGVAPERITISAHCTRCQGSPFFSHRAGHTGRQFGFLAVRGDRSGQ